MPPIIQVVSFLPFVPVISEWWDVCGLTAKELKFSTMTEVMDADGLCLATDSQDEHPEHGPLMVEQLRPSK